MSTWRTHRAMMKFPLLPLEWQKNLGLIFTGVTSEIKDVQNCRCSYQHASLAQQEVRLSIFCKILCYVIFIFNRPFQV